MNSALTRVLGRRQPVRAAGRRLPTPGALLAAQRARRRALAYSFHLKTECTPPHYKKDLGAITQPLLVFAGTADEALHTDQYEPVIPQCTLGQVELLDV